MKPDEAFEPYREKEAPGRPVSNVKNPGRFSCENLILFTVEAHFLGGISHANVEAFLDACEVEPGRFIRYPGLTEKHCSHDDYTAIAVFSRERAKRIYAYGEAHGWSWPGVGYLPRIFDFQATVKAAAGVPLSVHDELFASLGILGDALIRTTNQYNGKPDVGGTILIYLKQKVLARKSWAIDFALMVWRLRMEKLFGSMANVYGLYFAPMSPWALYGQRNFR